MLAEKNAIYLIAGYAVFLGGIGFYLLSLVLRRHNLQRDEQTLEQIAVELQGEQRITATSPKDEQIPTHG